MNKILIITLVILTSLATNTFAKQQMHCSLGWSGGDHGYTTYREVVISDKPKLSIQSKSEADLGYKVKRGSKSAILSLSTGWDNKQTYGSDAVLNYRVGKNTDESFLKENYAFAKDCLAKNLSPATRKKIQVAYLNPKTKIK
jgi:hypothetical protein